MQLQIVIVWHFYCSLFYRISFITESSANSSLSAWMLVFLSRHGNINPTLQSISSLLESGQWQSRKYFANFSLSFSAFHFYPPLVSPNNPLEFLRPGPFIPKSTRTQLKIHFVWPKSEGVCAMDLLHSALKLVLWRRMGYYYLLATHPAIKTSGATSPQRSAAALPPFLSLSACATWATHNSERNSTTATLPLRQTQEPDCSPLCLLPRSCLWLLDFPPPGSFSFCFLWMGTGGRCKELVNGQTSQRWLTDRLVKRQNQLGFN